MSNSLQNFISFSNFSIDHLLYDIAVVVLRQWPQAHQWYLWHKSDIFTGSFFARITRCGQGGCSKRGGDTRWWNKPRMHTYRSQCDPLQRIAFQHSAQQAATFTPQQSAYCIWCEDTTQLLPTTTNRKCRHFCHLTYHTSLVELAISNDSLAK